MVRKLFARVFIDVGSLDMVVEAYVSCRAVSESCCRCASALFARLRNCMYEVGLKIVEKCLRGNGCEKVWVLFWKLMVEILLISDAAKDL